VCVTSFPSLPGQAGGSIPEGFVYWRVCGGLEEHNGFDEDEPGEQGSKQVCISDPQKSGDTVITSGLRNLLPTVQQKTFEGEDFCEFHGFVAIHESFLCEIWECGVLWRPFLHKNRIFYQFTKVFSLESFPLCGIIATAYGYIIHVPNIYSPAI